MQFSVINILTGDIFNFEDLDPKMLVKDLKNLIGDRMGSDLPDFGCQDNVYPFVEIFRDYDGIRDEIKKYQDKHQDESCINITNVLDHHVEAHHHHPEAHHPFNHSRLGLPNFQTLQQMKIEKDAIMPFIIMKNQKKSQLFKCI